MYLFQERLRQRDLKVHEKTTYASKVNFKTAQMIKPTDSDEEEKVEETDKAVAVKDDPQFTIAVTRGHCKASFSKFSVTHPAYNIWNTVYFLFLFYTSCQSV